MYVARLINSASNCYLNSTLQGLAACTQLIDDFRQLEIKYQNIESLKIFNNLLKSITGSKSAKVNAFQSNLFINWKKRGQQDSFEVLTYAISEVYKELRKKENVNDIEKWVNFELPMRFIMGYDIKCCNNHVIACPKQVALALHVPIIEKSNGKSDKISGLSIQSLVNKYLDETEIEDYVCDDCSKTDSKNNENKSEIKAKKFSQILSPLPRTICVHLQRTRWINGSMKKLTDSIKIDEKLEITYQNNDNKPITNQFSLKAVIVHSGNIFFGHYVCYRLCSDKWYFTSDSTVKESDIKTVMSQQPYILFYE